MHPIFCPAISEIRLPQKTCLQRTSRDWKISSRVDLPNPCWQRKRSRWDDVFRKIAKRTVLNLNTKIWLSEADFDRKYFPEGWQSTYSTKRGDRRTIIFPIVVRLFLGRSHKLYCAEGKELPRRWTEKLTIAFVKETHWKDGSYVTTSRILLKYGRSTPLWFITQYTNFTSFLVQWTLNFKWLELVKILFDFHFVTIEYF